MNRSEQALSASEAARQLGVSVKALRLYEQRGLISPVRTSAGWRTYGPPEMARATEIVALRALGLSFVQVGQVLNGDPACLEPLLTAHQATQEAELRKRAEAIEKVRRLRADLAQGKMPRIAELARLMRTDAEVRLAFDLPWPWGGERFELRDIRPLNFIVGPLGSGKTRLARAIAEILPQAAFLGLDRAADDGAAARARLAADAALTVRVNRALGWLVEEGAGISTGLLAVLVAIEAAPAALVIDMVEQGLDRPTQEALAAWLHQRRSATRPLFLLTRSSAILDLAVVGPEVQIILCPANHSPPTPVLPYPGAPGYEAVATCLATPDVRARTEGVIAWRPQVA